MRARFDSVSGKDSPKIFPAGRKGTPFDEDKSYNLYNAKSIQFPAMNILKLRDSLKNSFPEDSESPTLCL